MTLLDTLRQNFMGDYSNESFETHAQIAAMIAEEFAIQFHLWMRQNDIEANAERFFHYTDEDMMNVFKEEMGL
jgi:hypothetical protein